MKSSQGINRTRQAKLALDEFYDSFYKFTDPHPFQTYHAIGKETAAKLQARQLPTARPEFRDIINIGGRGSGKTVVSLYTGLSLSTDYPGNLGVIVRRHWSELENSIIYEFGEVLNKVTDGHPEYLVEGPTRKQGFFEYIVFTSDPKNPSRIIIKPEPEKASDAQVANAYKGIEAGWFLCDELTELKEATWSALQDSLRHPKVPLKRGMGMTNPPVKGHWLYRLAREMEAEEAQGETPQVLIIRSQMTDNPFLDPEYIPAMKRKYKNDPIRYAMLIEGRDGVDIDGMPVFKGSFTTQHNVDDIKSSPFDRIYVGMDFGWRNASAVFAQITDRGYVNILGELNVQQTTVEQFGKAIQNYIIRKWPRANAFETLYFGDPAASQHSAHDGETTASLLRKKCGIKVKTKKRKVGHGLDTLRDLFTDFGVEGSRPRLVLDSKGCPELITGLMGGYRFKQAGGVVKPEPYKDEYYDHKVDALRYLTDNLFGPHKQLRDHISSGSFIAEGMERKRRDI